MPLRSRGECPFGDGSNAPSERGECPFGEGRMLPSERGECPFGEGRMPLRLSRGKAGRPAKIKDVAK